jgi:hypothetical protein
MILIIKILIIMIKIIIKITSEFQKKKKKKKNTPQIKLSRYTKKMKFPKNFDVIIIIRKL